MRFFRSMPLEITPKIFKFYTNQKTYNFAIIYQSLKLNLESFWFFFSKNQKSSKSLTGKK